jgi:anti-sigma factor RsiW
VPLIRPFSDTDLHAFVDDQISAERRAMIASYLKATPTEAARVDVWRRQNEAIRSVFSSAASEPVPIWLTIGQLASSKGRQDQAPSDRDGVPAAVRARLRRAALGLSGLGLPLVTAIAVVLAFVAGLAAPSVAPRWASTVERWLPDSPRTAALHTLAGRAAEAHRIFGMDPDTPAELVTASAGDLESWLRRRLTFPVRVPDLRTAGWMLRGGRFVPGVDGAAALLIYEDVFNDRLSVFVGRMNNPATFDTSYQVVDGSTLVWMDGPLGFGIATSREGNWLPAHAQALYRAVYQSSPD